MSVRGLQRKIDRTQTLLAQFPGEDIGPRPLANQNDKRGKKHLTRAEAGQKQAQQNRKVQRDAVRANNSNVLWRGRVESTLKGYKNDRLRRIAASMGVKGVSNAKKGAIVTAVLGVQDTWGFNDLKRVFDIR
jgi:hypothetical protein